MLTPQELIDQYQIEQKVFHSATGVDLPYCYKVMNEAVPGAMATLVVLHGAGERGSDNALPLVHGATQLFKFLETHPIKVQVLFPQCPKLRQWVDTPWSQPAHTMKKAPTPELQSVIELLQQLIAAPSSDPERVYTVGLSMGAYGAWELLSRHGEYFAGAVIACGGADVNQLGKMLKVDLQIFHGEADTSVPVCRSRDVYQALVKLGARRVTYHELLFCGHNCWTPAFNDQHTWDRLFAARRLK